MKKEAFGDAWRKKKSKANSLPVAGGQGLRMADTLADSAKRRRAMPGAWNSTPEYGATESTGTSIFDPVLCELTYRWFCPPGGVVLDPFAGGSVRGVVAAWLGRKYYGIDLHHEQIEANRAQWADVAGFTVHDSEPVTDPDAQTPVETRGDVLVKRDDLLVVAGVRGGKVRTCWRLAQGATGLVTAGSRSYPQVNIVAHVAAALGLPCELYVPWSNKPIEGEVAEAAEQPGATLQSVKPGHNTVIVARARSAAAERGYREIPFGMECIEAVNATAAQAEALPWGSFDRIVVPVGSGMSLAGILCGMVDAGQRVPIVGVIVGADPRKRLDEWAPGWRDVVTLVDAATGYDEAMPGDWRGIVLDPHYEAKCVPLLQARDLFWIVGCRNTARASTRAATSERPTPTWAVGDAIDIDAVLPDVKADLVFTCPPCGDLEVYSDDARDLSAKSWDGFLVAYREIIRLACQRLRDDRFAAIVVGDLRDKAGAYRGLPRYTIEAFEAAGLRLYNEAVLLTAIGSLPVRAGKIFEASRKLGKTHQNVLVFVKGDPKRATAVCGPVECGDVAEGAAAI